MVHPSKSVFICVHLWFQNEIPSITCGGEACSELHHDGNGLTWIFGLKAPPTGTVDVVISDVAIPGQNSAYAQVNLWTGIDQTTPKGDEDAIAGGFGAPFSFSLTTPVGSYCTDCYYGTGAMGAGQTLIDDLSGNHHSSYKARTGATTSMGWGSDDGGCTAIVLNAATS